MNEYEIGTSVQVRGSFRNLLGNPFDPSAVVCAVQKPDRTEVAYTYGDGASVVKDSTGNYHLWVLTDQVGRYVYRWKGTGVESVTNERAFTVSRSVFTTP